MTRRTLSAGLVTLAFAALPAALPAQGFTPGDRVIYQESFSQPADSIVRHLRNRCAISVNGDHVAVWLNNVQAADEQGMQLGRGSRLLVRFEGVEDPTLLDQNIPVWMSNIRIAGFAAR